MQVRTRLNPGRRALVVAAAASGLSAAAPAQSVRPETGALLGLQRQTDMIFVHGLDERAGAAPAPAANRGSGNSWARAFGTGDSSTSDSGLYDADGKTWGLQGGVDLPGPRSLERWRFGVMGSVGGARADGTVVGSPATSRGRGDGFGLGMYGTWFADTAQRLGWYADLWAHYAWFDNKLDTSGLARSDYRSHNTTASAEAGYAFPLEAAAGWTLTPQMQWVYIHNHSYNFTESDGTAVEGAHRGAWSSRFGVRLQRQAEATDSAAQSLHPYVAVNWWHDSSGDEVIYNNARSFRDLYPSDRLELKGGAAMAIGKQWSAWGDLALQAGNQSYRAWAAGLGARYAW